MIKLGSKVKDKITGFTGIATARTQYLNGCTRILVEGPINKDGKSFTEYFDVGQLEIVDEKLVPEFADAVLAEGKPPGGPGRMEAPRG